MSSSNPDTFTLARQACDAWISALQNRDDLAAAMHAVDLVWDLQRRAHEAETMLKVMRDE